MVIFSIYFRYNNNYLLKFSYYVLENEIIVNLLNKLSECELREMCPHLGARVRFRKKINGFF